MATAIGNGGDMSAKMIGAILVIGIAVLALFAWSRNTARAPTESQAGSSGAGQTPPSAVGPGGSEDTAMMPQSGGDPGVEWAVPKRWSTEPAASMRLATYTVPASGGGESASCGVFYFGSGQGGGVEQNIARWIDEFENPQNPERSSRTVDGLEVFRLRVHGTHLAHARMGGPAEGQQQNYELLGAIVEGPSGSVFFKLTGPAKVVDGAAKEFDGMLASLKKK